jgi:hypothetical protein
MNIVNDIQYVGPTKIKNFKIDDFINKNKTCSIKEICDSTELSNDIVNQVIIWLSKYSFISIGRNNE